jgi:hypothetical protein
VRTKQTTQRAREREIDARQWGKLGHQQGDKRRPQVSNLDIDETGFDGWLEVADPSRRGRAYSLSAIYRQYIGGLSAMNQGGEKNEQ